MTWFKATVALACLVLASATADARPKQPRQDSAALTYCASDQSYRTTCGQPEKRLQSHRTANAAYEEGQIIGGRPAGCPRAYCGCGLARYLGLKDARLNLAWNWARLFPRAHAGPGMAAVWRHHVAYIESMSGDGTAMLRDYNSGGGLSRLHERSIRGAVIVDPRSRVAMR